jgi:hypothetical protein
LRLAFLTSTPLDVVRGSGTFSGISTLARGLRGLGCEVELFTPALHLPVYTLERLWFNEQVRRRDFSGFDAVVGFDMDGYRVRTSVPRIASIKGVIADEMRFERQARDAQQLRPHVAVDFWQQLIERSLPHCIQHGEHFRLALGSMPDDMIDRVDGVRQHGPVTRGNRARAIGLESL